MSLIDPIVKLVTFFKFLKPKTFTYGIFPQSVKSPSVTLKETQYSGLFDGSDGATYVSRTVRCKKYVVFSDGQRVADGETAYFKFELLVWEMGGHLFTGEKKHKGSIAVTKYKKSDSVYCTSKYVLAPTGAALDSLGYADSDEGVFSDSIQHPVGLLGYYSDAYAIKPGVWARGKGHASKKATDFAIACGVSVKGRKAYHTAMSNGLCAAPNGKSVSKAGKVTAGEVLWFSAKKEDVLKQRAKTLKK